MNFFSKMKFKSLKKTVLKAHTQREQTEDNKSVAAEVNAQLALAKFYDKHLYDKDIPHAEVYGLECYRVAAELGNAMAQYTLAERLIKKGRFWDNFATTIYGSKFHKKYASAIYEEAFAYLKMAEDNDYALAKRLHGLALVNGWGVERNIDEGFHFVIQSIDMEKAWDRATKIFSDSGLNSPEFFEALRRHKSKA